MALTGKEQALIDHYCTDAENNGCKAFRMAGYSTKGKKWRINAQKVLSKDYIKQAIAKRMAEIRAKSEDAVIFLRTEHLRLATLCEQKGDMVNATRNLEGYGRTHGSYTDNLNTADTTKQAELTEQEKVEAKRLAGIRLKELGKPQDGPQGSQEAAG